MNDTDTYRAQIICNVKKEMALEKKYAITFMVTRKSGPHPAEFCDWLRKTATKLMLPLLRSNVIEKWEIMASEKVDVCTKK